MLICGEHEVWGPLGWFHAELWCYGQWLPGDPKGFRSRGHRIHSSGDYKNPPPKDEHAGLFKSSKASLKQPPVTLAVGQRAVVGELCLRWLEMKSLTPLAICVGRVHSHLFVQLPVESADATVGKLKRYVSTQASKRVPTLPPKIFAKSGEPKAVETVEHAEELMPYIVEKHLPEGAWVWSDVDAFNRLILGGQPLARRSPPRIHSRWS